MSATLHAFVRGIADELEDVFALHGVAAGEDEDGNVHVGDLVDKRLAFSVGELVGMRDGLGGGAAVLAGQVTGLRDFPDGQEGGFVEVEPATCGNVVHRLHCGLLRNRGGPDEEQQVGKQVDKHVLKPGRKAGKINGNRSRPLQGATIRVQENSFCGGQAVIWITLCTRCEPEAAYAGPDLGEEFAFFPAVNDSIRRRVYSNRNGVGPTPEVRALGVVSQITFTCAARHCQPTAEIGIV